MQALEIWSQGKKIKAVETLLEIDWTQPIEFFRQPYLFTMTEKECVSLKPKDQKQALDDIMATAATLRRITNELSNLGSRAMSAQD